MWAFPQAGGTVVVGCDSSWESQNAVVAATLEASLRGVDLVLLAVAEHRPYWPDHLDWVARAQAEAEHCAQAAADRAMARVVTADPAMAVHTVFVKDFDSSGLADVAGRAGLLVLGRRGDGGQLALSLGSTSAELARHFHCPMLVVHDHDPSRERDQIGHAFAVIAGMDTLGRGDTVLAVAVTEAVIRDLPLVVVQAVQRGQSVDRAVITEDWRRCRAAMRRAGLPAGVPNRLVITDDDPAPALLQRVRPGDLLVVGTRGQGCLAGLTTRSVSMEILDNMTCDVMVVQTRFQAATDLPSALVGHAGRS